MRITLHCSQPWMPVYMYIRKLNFSFSSSSFDTVVINMDDQMPGLENSSLTNATTDICSYFNLSTWTSWSLIPAAVIFALFCFLEQRVKLWPTCCQGRPGVAFPVNLVDSYTDRWSFAFAFGSMSTSLASLFLYGDSTDLSDIPVMFRGTIRFLITIERALIISLIFYPILLCLSTKRKLVGNVIGLLYSTAWFVVYLSNAALTCGLETSVPGSEVFTAIALFGTCGSGLVCFFALMIRFSIGLIKDIKTGLKVLDTESDISEPDFTETHFYHRVKFLLKPPPPEKSGNAVMHFFRHHFASVPGFRFSRRNICTLVLTEVTTFQIVFVYLYAFGFILDLLRRQEEYNALVSGVTVVLNFYFKLEVIFWVTVVVAVIIVVLYTIDMQLRYRRHTLQLWRGDRSFCSQERVQFASMLVSSMRYSGYHVAFTAWGFVIMQLLLLVISVFLVFGISLVISLLEQFWLALVISLAFNYAQVFISRFVFLQRAPDQEQSRFLCCIETTLGLDNRRIFHVTVYILLFVNFLLGLLSCFIRIVKAILIGTVFIGRLDRCTLIKGWESWDQGFAAYIGFLQLEVAHTHPVLVTFCHFLLKTVRSDQGYTTNELVSIISNVQVENRHDMLQRGKSNSSSPREPSTSQLSRRMRNRWLLALTLARNPKLAAQRKAALMEAK